MMKRITGLLLAAILLFALVPTAAFASSEEYVENRSGSAVGIYEKLTDETPVKKLKNGSRVRYLGTESADGNDWYKTPDGYIKKVDGVEIVTVKTAELIAEDVSVPYDGKKHAIKAKVVDGEGYSIEYSKDGGKNWSSTAPSLKKPGKLTVQVRALKKDEKTLEKTVTLEVTAEAASGTSVTIVNCKYAVNVRKGPSSKTSCIGTAAKGRVYALLGVEDGGKWYKIQYTASTVGYVFYEYVKVGNETPSPEPSIKTGTIVNVKTHVNIRAKASSSSKILGTAKNGETFDVLGKSGNWVKIRFNGKDAYVFHRYISIDGSDPEPTTEKKGTIVNCNSYVNIRAKASSSSKILGTAKKGEVFTVLGKSGNWVKVRFNGKNAYIFHTYIHIEGEPEQDTVTIVNCKTQVNVREKASSSSKLLGVAKKGETFDLLGKSGNWYKIDFNGKTAYIFHKYIKVN